jgi:class 3 adenylate cyclase/predicted ATPase
MQCPQCHFNNLEGQRFCSECGTGLSLACPDCGAAHVAEAKFCGNCGRVLKRAFIPSTAAAPSPRALPLPPHEEASERRQLTVMFCDLADSTALSERLDPEDTREVMRLYQETATRVIAEFEGFIARYMGDGILAYFGYPRAYENAAERAIRAGLKVVEAVSALEPMPGLKLRVRVGIATGLVVVGDTVGPGWASERHVVGDAPNLAARLQSLAPHNSVIIAPSTQRLASGQFHFEDLGEQTLKGIAQPVRAWRVIGVRHVESRFQAARVAPLTPLVGRESECTLLRERWRRVIAGQGQVVDIGGEAGIGKSRLARVVIDETRHDDSQWVIELQCSPFHKQSALYPVADQLRQQIFGDERQQDDAARWAAIDAFLRTTSLNVDEALPLFANLLSVPPPPDRPPSTLSPDRARLLTRHYVAALLIDLAKTRPGIFILEDLHWADPSTLDLVDFLVERIRDARILVLLTHRPEFDRPLPPQPHVTSLALSRLRGADASELVRLAFREQDFDPDVLRKVIEKTDGVPLYIEEFTKAVVESRLAAITAATTQVVIPSSLHDSLLARLDLLGEAKGVAQLASMLGREFGRDVLAAVWTGSPESLASGLARLIQAEFIYPANEGPRERFLFKHALIQDAAYESLLKSSRVAHHRRIAEALQAGFPDVLAEQAEVVAHHYAAGRMPERAAQLWLNAGQQSLRRNAHVEAASHLRSALEALAELPDGPPRALAELDVQITLGTALVAAKGYASADVEATWTRAQQLCAVVGDVPQQFPALFGLWMYECVRANHRAALDLSTNVLRRAEAVQSDDLLIEAHLAMGISNFFLGEFVEARAHFDRVGVMYDAARHGGHRFQFGQDPASVAMDYLSWIDWLCGDPARALATSDQAMNFARSLEHPFTLSFALAFAGWLRLYLRDIPGADTFTREEVQLCTDESIPVFLAHGQVLAAWSQCEKGVAEAPAEMQSALDLFRATGSRCFLPYWDAFHAEALSARGDSVAAATLLDRAFVAMDATHERWAEPELHRLRGVLLEREGGAPSAIEACHRRALASARALGAKAWELRAAASLAGCLHSQGRTDEARDELSSALSGTNQAQSGRDLAEALVQLQSFPA